MGLVLGGVLLSLLVGTTGARLVDRRRHALKFGTTLQDYIMFRPDMSPLANALTVCTWIKRLSSNYHPTWLYYATRSQEHEIWITNTGSCNYFLDTLLNLYSKINPSLGVWNHYCLTWSTTSNTRKVYFNGELMGQGATPSRTLSQGGILFFGHERHYSGSDTAENEIFGGELFKVNFFAKELTAEEVREMKDAGLCSDIEEKYGRVRYLRWEDLLLEERQGNVTEVDPGCPTRQCEGKEETGNETETGTEGPTEGRRDGRSEGGEEEAGKNETECECEARPEITKWDLLYTKDFYNQTLTAELLKHLRSYWDELGMWVLAFSDEYFISYWNCSPFNIELESDCFI